MNDGPLAERKVEFQNRVRENFISNLPMGIMQGMFYYAALGFYNFGSIFASFVYDISRSEMLVGLVATIMSIGYTAAQVYAPAAIQHLVIKKKTMLWFGFLYRLPWFIIGFSLLIFPPGTIIWIVIIAFLTLQFFNGLYLSSFFDFMSKVVPLERRGTYFGMRNSISIAFQAGAGYGAGLLVGRYSYLNGSEYVLPMGYALCFFLAFAVHLVDLWLLSKIKEEPAVVPGEKTSVIQTIQGFPTIFKTDKNFALYCMMRALISLSFYTSSFIIVYAKNRIDVTGPMLGIFTAVNLVALAAGTFTSGQIANRIGFKRLLEVAAFSIAIVYFLSPFLHSFESFFLFFAGVGFLTGGIFLSLDNLIMEFGRPDNRPSYISLSFIVAGVTGMIGPLVAGFIANRGSFVLLFILIGVIILSAALIMKFKLIDPREVKEYWQ